MKIQLELNILDDGRIFLNRWDMLNGNDVIAEIKNGKPYMDSDDGKEYESTLNEFISLVKYSV